MDHRDREKDWADVFHFNAEAKAIQAARVAEFCTGKARVVKPEDSAPGGVVVLANAKGKAVISVVGATVLSYVPAGGADAFFRVDGFCAESKAFPHGGMPIAWPWFGRKNGTDVEEDLHGFVRTLPWKVVEKTDSRVVFELVSDATTRTVFDCDFRLTNTIELGDRLSVAFRIENTDSKEMKIKTGFHPFFRVSDNAKLLVRGLEGVSKVQVGADNAYVQKAEDMELVDVGLGRKIVIGSTGGDLVNVWNDYSQWLKIYVRGGEREFCCVEPMLLGRKCEGVSIAPGEVRLLTISIGAEPLERRVPICNPKGSQGCLTVMSNGTKNVGRPENSPVTFYVPPEGFANVTENDAFATGSVRKTVAFLGGSITEMDGFRPRVMRQLRAKYPRIAFTEIAAGLSSTCSDAGAFRLDEDVLSKGVPDLFVVEAAVNDDQDGHFSFDHCVRGMEGCIRRVLLKNPSSAVVVGLMVNFEQYQQLTNGVTPLQYAAHAQVARHYGAALADVGSALARSGKMTWEEYKDCHPSPEGCDLGADVVMSAIETVFDPCVKPSVRTLPSPINELSYYNGRCVSFDRLKLGAGWQVSRPSWEKIEGQKRSYFTCGDALWTELAGAECEFSFSGTAVAAFLTAGPDSGNLEVSVDGAPFKVLNLRADFGELHYPYVQFIDDELKPGRHVVRLRSVAAHRDAGLGTAIRIHRLYANEK